MSHRMSHIKIIDADKKFPVWIKMHLGLLGDNETKYMNSCIGRYKDEESFIASIILPGSYYKKIYSYADWLLFIYKLGLSISADFVLSDKSYDVWITNIDKSCIDDNFQMFDLLSDFMMIDVEPDSLNAREYTEILYYA